MWRFMWLPHRRRRRCTIHWHRSRCCSPPRCICKSTMCIHRCRAMLPKVGHRRRPRRRSRLPGLWFQLHAWHPTRSQMRSCMRRLRRTGLFSRPCRLVSSLKSLGSFLRQAVCLLHRPCQIRLLSHQVHDIVPGDARLAVPLHGTTENPAGA